MTALSGTVTPTRRLFCVISTARCHRAGEFSSSWRESVSLSLEKATGSEYKARSVKWMKYFRIWSVKGCSFCVCVQRRVARPLWNQTAEFKAYHTCFSSGVPHKTEQLVRKPFIRFLVWQVIQRDVWDCPICLTGLCCPSLSPDAGTSGPPRGRGAVLLSCSHLFHQPCLEAFEAFSTQSRPSCPLCRSAYHKKLI